MTNGSAVAVLALTLSFGCRSASQAASAEASTGPRSEVAAGTVNPLGSGPGAPGAGPAACDPVVHDATRTHGYHRDVPGAHRTCSADNECVSVKLDCSNLNCSAVHRDWAAAYATPIDCSGYEGTVVDYDCDPRFDSEVARCVDTCCASVRIVDP